MGLLEFKWWIRDNVTDPISGVIEKSGEKFFSSAMESIDQLHRTGDKVIDAACHPIDATSATIDWVKENPKEATKIVASAAVTVAAIVVTKKMSVDKSSRIPETLGVIDYGQDKQDGSHDHRYNKGKDRTRAQKQADSLKKK